MVGRFILSEEKIVLVQYGNFLSPFHYFYIKILSQLSQQSEYLSVAGSHNLHYTGIQKELQNFYREIRRLTQEMCTTQIREIIGLYKS